MALFTAQSDDHDGDGFGREDNSCLVTVESLPLPEITNIETGEDVNLLRAYWLEVDLVDKEFVCQFYYESINGNGYTPYDWTLTYRHLNWGSDSDVFVGRVIEEFYDPSTGRTDVTTDELWSLDNGYYNGPSPLGRSRYVEFVDGENQNTNEVQIWSYGRGDEFVQCKTVDRNDFLWPNVFQPTTNITDLYHVQCVDSDPVGDGYGWDGFGSCQMGQTELDYRYVTPEYVGAAPLNGNTNDNNTDNGTGQDGCDYSNAILYNGWGWNSTTRESCPPRDSNQNDDNSDDGNMADQGGCDYSSASQHGGWGWNNTTRESCPPLGAIDDNSTPVGDDDTRPDDNSSSLCVDTDGDGWGWDGTQSCRVGEDSNNNNNTTGADSCDYSDSAQYNGWGWDPVARESCPPR